MMLQKNIFLLLLLPGVYGIPLSNKQREIPANGRSVMLLVSYDSTLIKPGNDTIVHTRNKTVNWNDFKGEVPAGITASANSSVGFMYKAGITSEGGRKPLHITIRITSFFVRSSSWAKTKDMNLHILKHEQLHFDMARIGAEKFRDKLLAADFNNVPPGEAINKAYREAWTEYLALQDQYDTETDHSMDAVKQYEWNKKITRWLNAIP
jgi:hypothetical protein